MNSQDQEISELRRTLPEEHTQQIIILLGRMIHHRLTETGNSTGTTTGKGLEPLVRSRHHRHQREGFAAFMGLQMRGYGV